MGYEQQKKRTVPELHRLRETVVPQEIQEEQSTGRYGSVFNEDALRPLLPSGNTHQTGSSTVGRREKTPFGKGDSTGEEMRAMRIDSPHSQTPYQQEHSRQSPGERDGLVQPMPLQVALGERLEAQEAEAVQTLRIACQGKGAVLEALSKVVEIWRSACDEKKVLIWFAVGKQLEKRLRGNNKARLKQFGNGWVPQVAAAILRAWLASHV